MEQKNKHKKVLTLIACMALAVVCVTGGAIARYTSSVHGTGSVSAAKWAFEVNGKNVVTASDTGSFTLDLFDTIQDSNGSAETDISSGKIAPGTSGAFAIKVDNKSEVNATYKMNFSVTNTANIPLEYSVNGTEWKSQISDLNFEKALNGETGTDTVTVQWRWAFDGNDTQDTALGIQAQTAAPAVQVNCDLTFTQMD